MDRGKWPQAKKDPTVFRGGDLTPVGSLVSVSDQSLKLASISHEDGSPRNEMCL